MPQYLLSLRKLIVNYIKAQPHTEIIQSNSFPDKFSPILEIVGKYKWEYYKNNLSSGQINFLEYNLRYIYIYTYHLPTKVIHNQ